MKAPKTDKQQIRVVIYQWRDATRAGKKDEVLANHAKDVLVFDPIPPFQYEGAAAYRKSFDEWWPDSQEGSGKFDLEDLQIFAGDTVAYAHGIIVCGGTAPDGEPWQDKVRLTVCLRKLRGKWQIAHTHSSMPLPRDGDWGSQEPCDASHSQEHRTSSLDALWTALGNDLVRTSTDRK